MSVSIYPKTQINEADIQGGKLRPHAFLSGRAIFPLAAP